MQAMNVTSTAVQAFNIRIINRHHREPLGAAVRIYIGRGSPLGNPFPIGPSCTREESVQKYDLWLQEQIQNPTSAALAALRNIIRTAQASPVEIECYCAPRLCHGTGVIRTCQQLLEREATQAIPAQRHTPNTVG